VVDPATHPVLQKHDLAALEARFEQCRLWCGAPRYVILCVLLTAFSSVLLGYTPPSPLLPCLRCSVGQSTACVWWGCRYDIGVLAGAKLKIQKDFQLSDRQIELVVGILNFVSAFGGLLSGRLCDRLGRRKAVGVAALVFLGGAALMAFAPGYAVLMVGRVVTGQRIALTSLGWFRTLAAQSTPGAVGLAVGTGLTIAPLYTAGMYAFFRGQGGRGYSVSVPLTTGACAIAVQSSPPSAYGVRSSALPRSPSTWAC
jgi:MFS family permease